MPVVRINVTQGHYDEAELTAISKAIHGSLVDVISCPPDDFFQFIDERAKNRFLHTSSLFGLNYTDRLILLEITFLLGRSKETRLALLKALNERIVAAVGISPDDLMVLLFEIPPENCTFGQGVAQRVNVVQKP